MNRRAGIIVLLVIVLAVVAIGYSRCSRSSGARFLTTTVSRGPITQTVTATGTLNPVVNVQVGSQVSGNIQKLFADFNSKVKANDVVAQIDPMLFQAAVTQAEGDLAAAQAQLELARVNAQRTQRLFEMKNSAQQDVDTAMANLHQAEANVKIKQGALDKAKADLEHTTIRSPVDGEVISRSVDVGQTVAASLQAPVIFQIANDLTKMQIDANVAEADVGQVAVGQTVDFTVDAFPSRTFHGKVVQVRNAPITVQNVVTYDTVIGVDNPDLKLKPGMTANVSVIIAHKDDVLKLANAALRFRPADALAPDQQQRNGPQWGGGGGAGGPGNPGSRRGADRQPERTVYLLSGGRPKPAQIKIGISDGINTEVDGLKEGDHVITGAMGANPAQQSVNPLSGAGPRRF